MSSKADSALDDDKKIIDVEEGEVPAKQAKGQNNEEPTKAEDRDDKKEDKEKKKDKKSSKKEKKEKDSLKDEDESSKRKSKKNKTKKEDKKYDKEQSSSRSRSRSRSKKHRRSPSFSKKAKYNRKRSDSSHSKRRSRSKSDDKKDRKANRNKDSKRRSSSSSRKKSNEKESSHKGKETRKRSRSPKRTDKKRDKTPEKQSKHERKDRYEKNEPKKIERDTKRRNEGHEKKKEIDDEPIDEEALKKIESQFAMVEEEEERIAKERREQRRKLLEQFGKMNDEENKKKTQAAMEEEVKYENKENHKIGFKEGENQAQQNQKISTATDETIKKIERPNAPNEENQAKQQASSNTKTAIEIEGKPTPSYEQQTEEANEESKENEETNNWNKRVIGEHKHDADKERYIKMIENMREKLQKEEEELREETDKEENKNKEEEQSKTKVQDQDFDMFCETPETLEAEKIKMPIVKGEQQSYDDENGYYRAQIGEILNGKYQITAKLGKGVFGNVFKGLDTTTNQEIAIKVLKSDEIYTMSGLKEREILTMLNEADRHNKRHVIRLLDSFDYLKHLVLVFELMEMDLRSAIKTFGKKLGLSLESVRSYARQLFVALAHLRKYKIIHADLKPDNILVTNNKKTLKLSDFGSAFPVDENTITPYLVARYYRAPEIILGCPYDMSVDVWSAACTIFELYTGKILFPGRDNNDMLKYILQTKGRLNNKMLKRGEFSAQYFDRQNNFLSTETDPVTKEKYVRPLPIGNKITRDIGNMLNEVEIDLSEEDRKKVAQLKDLLERCLTLDPNRRLNPEEVLKHPFINYDLQKLSLGQTALKNAF